jgi:TP901-1 family phage major tail protein
MAAQKGRDMLLKIDNAGTFVTVAGLRANQLTFNAQAVDATSQESPNAWRELLSGAGLKSAAIRGSGIFKDAASDALLRSAFFTGVIPIWQIIIPDFGVIQGAFQIAALDFAARHDGEVTFELALQSAGALTFAAV